MTAIRSAIKPTRRPGELGVHSVDRFHFAVPDLAVAKNFYGEFGLEIDENGGLLAMKTPGNPHVWVTLGEGPRKKLGHISFGAFEDDFDRFAERLQSFGRQAARSTARRRNERPVVSRSRRQPGRDQGRGEIVAQREVRVFGRLHRSGRAWRAVPARCCARHASAPRACPPVHPRRGKGGSVLYAHAGLAPLRPVRRRHSLSARHPRQRPSYDRLRHIERAGPASSELGRGLRRRHRPRRHAYAGQRLCEGMGPRTARPRLQFLPLCRRPVGQSFSEYSAGIDFVPADCDWKSGDHAPEDSFYVWGPNPPDYFTHNAEA